MVFHRLPIEAMCPLFRLLRAAEIEIFSTDLQVKSNYLEIFLNLYNINKVI